MRRLAMLGLIVLALVQLVACGDGGDERGDVEVFTNADALVLEQVSGVVGEVTEMVGPDAFVLRSMEGPREVLVVARATPPMAEGAIVEVAGHVVVLALNTFEDDFGLVYDDAYEPFGGDPVIRASSVEVRRAPAG